MRIYKNSSGKIIIDGENVDILNRISDELNVPNLIEIHNFTITGEIGYSLEPQCVTIPTLENLILPNDKILNRAELLEIE